MLLLSLALFVLVLVLPAIPGLREVRKPKDDGKLHILEQYVRDPRWFGRSFRHKLAPFVAEAREEGRAELRMRTDEEVRWGTDLRIPAGERVRGILAGDRVTVGRGAGIRDAYALEHLDVEPAAVARTLTSDQTLHVGSAVQILRWVDADGDVDVDADADLGLSASGGARITLGDRVRFERVWAAPVASRTEHTEQFAVDARNADAIGADELGERISLISYRTVRVKRGTVIPGHLKVHGAIELEPGVRVDGNVIARGNITLAGACSVGGHIFAEGDVKLGPGTRVARSGVAKTVYATGNVLLADDVEVFGWIVAENGGRTL